MSRTFCRALVALTMALTGACSGPGNPSKGDTLVAGYVLGIGGLPAVGAIVRGTASGVTKTVTTETTGRFVLGNYTIPEGQSVLVAVTLDGYQPATVTTQAQYPQTSVGVTLSPIPSDPASSAQLAIDSITMTSEGDSAGTFFYVPDLVLRETTGEGAATITEIVFATTSAGSASPVPMTAGCLRSHVVPAGKTWRLLDPANSDFYCQEIDTSGELKALFVTVRFVDPQGRLGIVTGSTSK